MSASSAIAVCSTAAKVSIVFDVDESLLDVVAVGRCVVIVVCEGVSRCSEHGLRAASAWRR